MRYFFHIAYKGTRFRGWQQQKMEGHRSVQIVLEKLLSKQLKVPVTVWGCGRTDAGVHASQYFFHIDVEVALPEKFLFRLHKSLPRDIAVYEIIPVDKPYAHARFDARARSYDYFIHLTPNPFWDDESTWVEYPLDLDRMQIAAKLLTKYNDFAGFCLQPDKHNHTRCTVTAADFCVNARKDRLRFRITANRFLRGMIRIIMFNLIEVGAGRMTVEAFEEQLSNARPLRGLKSAPPQGLFLSEIKYEYLTRPPVPAFDGVLWTAISVE